MDQSVIPTHANEMFCHAIYASWHVVNQSYKKHLAPLGLTYPQYITLTLLWEKDERIVGDLASSLDMETSTLTPLLKRLSALGHVTRQRSLDDERKVVVSLTASGKALQSKARSITACMIEDTGLTVKELDRLTRTLEKLRKGLKTEKST
ncbi:unnamed protein product [Ectocarpus sp. 12 AP-2014]